MSKITEEIILGAELVQDAASDIISAAKAALLARGITEEDEVVSALLAAAWVHHSAMAPHWPDGFVSVVRDMADTVERLANPN